MRERCILKLLQNFWDTLYIYGLCKFLLQYSRISPIITWIVGVVLIGAGIGLIIGLISPIFHLSNNITSGMTVSGSNNSFSTSIQSTGTSGNPVSTFATSGTASTALPTSSSKFI